MNIYCFTCREHILKTTDAFVMGGEYNGSMFEPAGRGKIWGNMFRQNAGVKKANLFCPRCEGQFINHGKLLSEYGVIHPGQSTVDKSFTIVAGPDHPLPGRLMFIVDSHHGADLVYAAAVTRQEAIDSLDDDLKLGELIVDTVMELPESMAKEGPLICPNCQKEYTNSDAGRRWYDKHVEGCGK